MSLKAYQQEFIDLVIKHKALSFGEFTLKSGRISPYFFNLGQIYTGTGLQTIGRCMAAALSDLGWDFQAVCGPAYKGIPLAVATAIGFADRGQSVPYLFNRKEAKAHGEKSLWVGAPLPQRVVLVDDVITAGTAIDDIVPRLLAEGASLAGIFITLDRQERGADGTTQSAIQSVSARYGVPVHSLINLAHILSYVESNPLYQQYAPAIVDYRALYGAL